MIRVGSIIGEEKNEDLLDFDGIELLAPYNHQQGRWPLVLADHGAIQCLIDAQLWGTFQWRFKEVNARNLAARIQKYLPTEGRI